MVYSIKVLCYIVRPPLPSYKLVMNSPVVSGIYCLTGIYILGPHYVKTFRTHTRFIVVPFK